VIIVGRAKSVKIMDIKEIKKAKIGKLETLYK
jgi:hypothetical protein